MLRVDRRTSPTGEEFPLTDELGTERFSGVLKKMVTATEVAWHDRKVWVALISSILFLNL